MVVLSPHEPKKLRPKTTLETSETNQEGAFPVCNPQLSSYPQILLIEMKDGRQISTIQLTYPSTCPQFPDLQDPPLLLLQVNLIQSEDKEHWARKKIPISMELRTTFQIIQDLHQIYLLLFLLVQGAHLHPNLDLLIPCLPIK